MVRVPDDLLFPQGMDAGTFQQRSRTVPERLEEETPPPELVTPTSDQSGAKSQTGGSDNADKK